MKHRFLRTLQLRLAVLDVLMINIVFFALQFLFLKYMHKRPNAEYMYFIFFLNGVWIAIASLKNIYSERYIGSFEQFTKVMLKAYVYLLLAVIIFLFFFPRGLVVLKVQTAFMFQFETFHYNTCAATTRSQPSSI